MIFHWKRLHIEVGKHLNGLSYYNTQKKKKKKKKKTVIDWPSEKNKGLLVVLLSRHNM